jgi:hypothetical protein
LSAGFILKITEPNETGFIPKGLGSFGSGWNWYEAVCCDEFGVWMLVDHVHWWDLA